MSNFQLTIVTPQGKVFEGEVTYLKVPGADGSLGILARHAPLIATLKKGELVVKQSTGEKAFQIGNGVLEVGEKGRVLVLSESASAGS